MAASTRRAALGAILAAPLGTAPAVASATHRRAFGGLARTGPADRQARSPQCPPRRRVRRGGHGLQQRLGPGRGGNPDARGGLSVSRLPDILAKAGCRARLDPLPEAEEQVRGPINGYADLDDMSVALAVAVMKLAEGTLCA
jgi:hypothetical protein